VPRPEVQASLVAPTQAISEAANWDWCDNNYFTGMSLATPWADINRRGVNIAQESCSNMKKDWELYDRQLDINDNDNAKLAKVSQAQTKPYFALYNRYTGVLRVFLWIGSNNDATTTGQAFVVKGSVTEGGVDQQATHLLDFYQSGLFPNLLQAPQTTEKVWVIPDPTPNVWLVLDIIVAYDPADYLGTDGYDKQLFLKFSVQTQNTSNIKLTGSIQTEIQSESPTSILSMANQSYADGMQTFNDAAKMGSWLTKEVQPGKFLSGSSVASQLGTLGLFLSGGGGVAAGLVTGGYQLFQRLFSDQTATSVMYLSGTMQLQGTIVDNLSSTGFTIPYSGSTATQAPLFAYKYPQPSMRKLGLFHMSRWSAYPFTHGGAVEPVSCLIQVNPNALSKVVSENYGYVWNSGTESEGVTMTFQDPTNPTSIGRQATYSFLAGLVYPVPKSWLRFAGGDLSKITGQTHSPCMDYGYSNSFPVSFLDFPDEYTLGVSGSLKINDRVAVYSQTSGVLNPGKVYNSGSVGQSFSNAVELGADAEVGSIFNKKGTVFLRDRSVVHDRLVSTIVQTQNQVSAPTAELSSVFNFPTPVGLTYYYDNWVGTGPYQDDPLSQSTAVEARRDVCVPSTLSCGSDGQRNVLHLAPGVYGDVVIRDGAELELSSGSYLIRNLQMESGSMLTQANSSLPSYVFVARSVTWRATANNVDPSKLFMVAFSNGVQDLTTPFFGTFMAPAGWIEMGSGRYDWYYGRFYAKQIEVHQNSRIVGVPFTH